MSCKRQKIVLYCWRNIILCTELTGGSPMNNKTRIQRLVGTAVLAALVIVLQFFVSNAQLVPIQNSCLLRIQQNHLLN